MSKTYENENKKWTEEDKNYLYDVWGELTILKISQQLKRSRKSILSFAEKNGLGGFLYNGAYLTTGQAAVIAGVDYTTIISWIKAGKLKAKFRKINVKRVYLMDIQDFKDFLKCNTNKWTTLKADLSIFNSDEEWLLDKINQDTKYKFKKTSSAWTINQEETLISLVNKEYSDKAIADILERTVLSIRRKKATLIEQGRLKNPSKKEIDSMARQFIIDNWGRISIDELSKATNKSIEQIKTIQWRYNLKSLYDIENNNLITLIELSKLLNISRDCARRWAVDLGLPKQEINKGNKKRFVVDVNDIIPFLENNKDRIAKSTYTKCKSIMENYFENNKKLKEAI